jgi:aspartyl-tRNA(Asn)/glutamyl-tRNA(Gln) amidotransferase subunit A
MTAVLDQSLRRIAGQIADGTTSSQAVVEDALSRHDPDLSAYVTWAPDFARAQARAADAAMAAGVRTGGLQGIPTSFKDLYGISGLPTFAGSPRALPHPWAADGPLVSSMRRRLAVIVGKSQSVEFASGGMGISRHHPVPRNPRDPVVHRAPGGSSSGAGVCVVEGTALVAFGTDTGGSVRIPASMTGAVGVKTTKGRWPTDGIVPLSPTFDTPGILTRSAADAAFAFEDIDGGRVPDRDDLSGLRLAVGQDFFWQGASPGIAERARDAVAAAEMAGAQLVDLSLTGAEEVFTLYAQGGIVSAELYSFLRTQLPDWIETLDPDVRKRMERGRALEAWEFMHRLARYRELSAQAAADIAPVDAILCPTVPLTPPPIADLADPDTYTRANMLTLRNKCVVSFLGLCAVTIPAGTDAEGMPVGLQIIGGPNAEARLLAIARVIERQLDRIGAWPLAHHPD